MVQLLDSRFAGSFVHSSVLKCGCAHLYMFCTDVVLILLLLLLHTHEWIGL